MSNLESAPSETICSGAPGARAGRASVLEPREVPLGGPRAVPVRRTLPQRSRSLIGAWCFVDHYGPDDVSRTGGMRVAGHPHTCLQTVSWLFTGEVEHRDTVGTHALVRPGEVNLMTAGSGIAHSEYSTRETTILHGVQLWIALPDEHRFVEPGFEHHIPPVIDQDGARIRVFIGELGGQVSPIATSSPLLGAEVTLAAGQTLDLDVDPTFEHGVLVDSGEVVLADVTGTAGELIHVEAGVDVLRVCSPRFTTRVLLLGGEPLGERIVMWWNFIGRSHEEIVTYRWQWQHERQLEAGERPGRFGGFPEQWGETLPAPDLPRVRLKSRG